MNTNEYSLKGRAGFDARPIGNQVLKIQMDEFAAKRQRMENAKGQMVYWSSHAFIVAVHLHIDYMLGINVKVSTDGP